MPTSGALRATLVPVAVAMAVMAVMVVWGATPIITRIALDDLPLPVIACLRTALAGLVAIPLLARGLAVVCGGREHGVGCAVAAVAVQLFQFAASVPSTLNDASRCRNL